MEETLREVPWLAGDGHSLADIDVIPYLWRLSNLQLDVLRARLPRVTDWFGRVTARPAFRSAIIEPALPDWIEGMRAAGSRARGRLQPVISSFESVAA